MNRASLSFPVTDFTKTKYQILNWCRPFRICSILDGHQYDSSGSSFEMLGGFGAAKALRASAGQAFQDLRAFADRHNDWLFGHFGFNLKSETELMLPDKESGMGFDDLFFFIPETLVQLGKSEITIGCLSQDPMDVWKAITDSPCTISGVSKQDFLIQSRFSKPDYIQAVEAIRNHILRGDCYEINFCQEFYGEGSIPDTIALYQALSEASPMPFGAYYRVEDQFLLCASPERYLKNEGGRLLSQPIKGTWARKAAGAKDEEGRLMLLHSSKDRAENIMVVDLVRNDLAKVCETGSVKVDELFGIYSFPLLHQMISTISGVLKKELHWTDAILYSFPMGSMTGAPKRRVLELIQQYEKTGRGLFSGSVGYVKPGGDFDFNVVIRSIFYNEASRYISFLAGSGITYNSDPAKEYEECLLKAEAIKKVLAG